VPIKGILCPFFNLIPLKLDTFVWDDRSWGEMVLSLVGSLSPFRTEFLILQKKTPNTGCVTFWYHQKVLVEVKRYYLLILFMIKLSMCLYFSTTRVRNIRARNLLKGPSVIAPSVTGTRSAKIPYHLTQGYLNLIWCLWHVLSEKSWSFSLGWKR